MTSRHILLFTFLASIVSGSGIDISCHSDEDCSLNGLCKSGKCQCDAAWMGSKCATFNILPAEKASGYRNINDPVMGNTSSWGGGAWYDATDNKWYMYATELSDHCGMHTWTTNSQTIRAASDDPLGLYKREAVIIPIWSHEVAVTRGPKGEYVAFFSYNPNEGPSRPVCKSCTDGSTDPKCKKSAEDKLGQPFVEDTDPSYMSWSSTATGNWSTPVEIKLPAKPAMDTNLAAVIKEYGSLVGMWRDHGPGGHHSTPHLITASNWQDASTYQHESTDLIFGKEKNPGGIEDMFMWVDARGNYHTIFHQMYDCKTCTAHAFSADGKTWKYSGTAATAETKYTDGTTVSFGYCERPHLVMDKTGKIPLALTNGVKIQGLSNNDQSFTLLRPLGTASLVQHEPAIVDAPLAFV